MSFSFISHDFKFFCFLVEWKTQFLCFDPFLSRGCGSFDGGLIEWRLTVGSFSFQAPTILSLYTFNWFMILRPSRHFKTWVPTLLHLPNKIASHQVAIAVDGWHRNDFVSKFNFISLFAMNFHTKETKAEPSTKKFFFIFQCLVIRSQDCFSLVEFSELKYNKAEKFPLNFCLIFSVKLFF